MDYQQVEAAYSAFLPGHGLMGVPALQTNMDVIFNFVKQQIARKKLLDEPLTVELCEKMGLVPSQHSQLTRVMIDKASGVGVRFEGANVTVRGLDPDFGITPCVRHLLASATLAGEDARKSIEAKIDKAVT